MRTVIISAFLAAASVISVAGQTAAGAQTPPAQPPNQDPQQKKAKPSPQPISPLIPVTNPADATTPDAAKLATPAGTPPATAPKTSATVDNNSYVIGSDDELAIVVFENQLFSTPTETVRPDGKITMPLIGDLQASGKTPEQLKNEVTDVLTKEYMNTPPHVSVIVVRVLSKNYYINGEVLKPGKYALTVPTTVMQALVNAGGFKDWANKKNIRIQRGAKFFHFNYNEVSKGKKLEQNIFLQPDDQIFVN